MLGAHRGMPQCLGDVGLAGSAGSGDEDRDLLLDEAGRGELGDEAAVVLSR